MTEAKSANETIEAIRAEVCTIQKALAAIEFQLRQLESESRAPRRRLRAGSWR